MISKIKECLHSNEMVGLVIPDAEYDEILIQVAGALNKDYNKLLYINVDKPYKTLISKLEQNGINTANFYFIDCITKTSKKVSSTKNCRYVQSPRAMDEIKTAIFDVLKKHRIDVTLIDSPSSLLTYYEHMDVLRLMHFLMAKLLVAECKGIFPFQKESAGPLKRSIEMFTDKVAYLGSNSGGYSNANSGMNISVNFDKMILFALRKIININSRKSQSYSI